mgnify:FL=1
MGGHTKASQILPSIWLTKTSDHVLSGRNCLILGSLLACTVMSKSGLCEPMRLIQLCRWTSLNLNLCLKQQGFLWHEVGVMSEQVTGLGRGRGTMKDKEQRLIRLGFDSY